MIQCHGHRIDARAQCWLTDTDGAFAIRNPASIFCSAAAGQFANYIYLMYNLQYGPQPPPHCNTIFTFQFFFFQYISIHLIVQSLIALVDNCKKPKNLTELLLVFDCFSSNIYYCQDVIFFNCRALVAAVPFFTNAEPAFVSEVVCKLAYEVFQPGLIYSL